MDTFDYFRQICAIPRESGNEDGMRRFLLAWAEENGIRTICDKAGNLIMKVKATEGMENVPGVALQGHMDMVCVKVPGSNHDFAKDGIEVYEDGDFLRARGTSLGGDNGIAIAMAMALFTDPEAVHGPLEAIFTFSEETGMDGAFQLDASLVESKLLINLDSEEEGVIYIGCAGGIDLVGKMETEQDDVPESYDCLEISIKGLKGGHSGGEIHKQRLNAISAAARILVNLEQNGIQTMLAAFDGGTRRNVIPSAATCKVCLPKNDLSKAKALIAETAATIKEENKYEEPGFELEVSESSADKAVCSEVSSLVAKALYACPHGVFSMSKALENVVETSDNLAVARMKDGKLHLEISTRSNVDSAKFYLAGRIKTILESFGIDCTLGDGYPCWTPDPSSRLARFCATAYEDLTGKKAVVTAIHAGLECGVISSKVAGMDSVSLGPDLFDVHSTNEHLSISSAKRTYVYLKHLLSII